MRRLSILLVLSLLIAVLAVPASAGPSDNPFVGSWESYDDFPGDFSHVRLQFGANGHFHLRDDAATLCLWEGFGFVPATISGFGEITDDDPWTFSGTGDLYCHTRDGRGRQLLAADVHSSWIYDPITDTLPSDFNCYFRTGSDPSACN